MSLEQIQQLIVVITSIAGIVVAGWKIIKKQESSYDEYAKKYYSEILEPTIKEIVLNKGTLENELMKYAQEKYSYIPTYISYMIHLINRGSTRYSWNDIKKVITMDYLFKRPGLGNSFINGITSIGNVFRYIFNLIRIIVGVLFFAFGLTFEIINLINILLLVVENGHLVISGIEVYNGIIALASIIASMLIIKSINSGGYELYPKWVEKIERIISERIGEYDTLMEEYKKKNPHSKLQEYDMLYLCIDKIALNAREEENQHL